MGKTRICICKFKSERNDIMNSVIKKTAAVFMAATLAVTGLSVNAFADSEKLISQTVTAEYAATVSKPAYSIKGSDGVRRIRLKSSTSGATIYYTTDGSKPTTSSKKYTGLIKITKTTKIRAIAVKGGNKSAVMQKTVRIGTMLGDVTGDGSIKESDYTRLKNYLAGSTSYICTDNADVDGNGKVNKKDLTILREYLDGDIDDFPAADAVKTLSKPTITVYKVYGGKKFKIESEDAASIYYTTNGAEPTRNSTRYTGTFIVDKDTTVKAIAYDDGAYSEVKSRSITVDRCSNPYSDMDTNKEYEDSVKVRLYCETSGSRIYYTTDGSDPVKYGKTYTGQLEFNENTTLKFYANAKGYSNSQVTTLNYKVKSSSYVISGMVWNDTVNETSVSDGIYSYGEQGINGITVMLLNTSTNNYEETTVTSTINGVAGSYKLVKPKPGNNYKVVFQFNGQKYRAYSKIVSGGNQAFTFDAFPLLTIRNDGAYNATNNARLTSSNNYNSAIVDGIFNKTYATTSSVYTSAASNVNLALASNIYGGLQLSFGPTTRTSLISNRPATIGTNDKIYANETVTYTLNVANSSSQNLKRAGLYLYLNSSLSLYDIDVSGSADTSYSYSGTSGNGYSKYLIECPTVRAGETLTFTITTRVNTDIRDGISIGNYAEVAEYAYENSCYDRNSVPGNFNFSVREKDEAQSLTLLAYSDVTSSQTLSWNVNNDFNIPIAVNDSRAFYFTLTNGTGDINELYFDCDNSRVNCNLLRDAQNNGYVLLVTGKSAGVANIQISLKRDASKNIKCSVTIV